MVVPTDFMNIYAVLAKENSQINLKVQDPCTAHVKPTC